MKVVSKQLRKYGNRHFKRRERMIKRNSVEGIRSLLDERKFKLAETCIEEYIEENGEDCYIIHEYGKFYEKQFMLKKAKKYFEKNINNNSENMYYSLYELAKLEKYERNYDKAIEYLNTIIRSNHYDKSHALLELTKVYIILERYDDAEATLQEIFNGEYDEKTYRKALSSLLHSKINNGKVKEAEIVLEELKEISDHPKTKLLEGELEEKKGNKTKAYSLYKEIIKNKKECTENASYELAKLEMEIENYDESIKLINTFVFDNNIIYNIEMYEVKINCYIKMGEYDKAKECINKLKSLNNTYDNISNYYLGKIEFYVQNYAEALEYYNKIDEIHFRTYRDSLYKKICCLIKLEKYEEAYLSFEELKRVDISKKYWFKYNTLEIYLKSVMGIPFDAEPKNYLESLMVDYNYQDVIDHINKHKENDDTKLNHTLFYENINVEELYQYALDQIKDENYKDNSFNDAYVFEYKGAGYNKTKELNYVKVITIPNTKKIITMYPYDYIDKNKKKEKAKEKVKTLSRIDKFNQKYGIT